MPASSLQARLEAVLRPLGFAAVDDFDHLERVRDLEGAVARACRRALAGPLPAPVATALSEVAELFEGAVPDDRDERVARIRRALARTRAFRQEGWARELLAAPLTLLSGVGPRRAESLAKRGLACIEQLLFHLPSGYDDRRALVDVGDLEVGQHATFIAEVQSTGTAIARSRGGRPTRVVEAVVGDATGSVCLKWFHGGDALSETLRKGTRVLVTGDVRRHRFTKQLVHPELERVESVEDVCLGDSAVGSTADPDGGDGMDRMDGLEGLRRIVPRYPTPEGIPARTLRGWIGRAVAEYADLAEGHLPDDLVRKQGLPGPAEALRQVHAPGLDVDLRDYETFASPAHRRLVLEELYLLELGLALRQSQAAALPGVAFDVGQASVRRAPEGLPFQLTDAQDRAWQEIRDDLARPHPMNRLLQGDVGCGKTVVALLAAVAAARSDEQAALMAPTELLAEQHARTLERLVGGSSDGLSLRMGLLTASTPRPEAEALRARMESGDVDLVIGTHALVQPDVGFRRLGLVVVDEQHRFGVRQRQALAAKREDGRHPHTLVMTATPIPRTLALTLYGDLDCSVIDELPPGRSPVRTLLVRTGEGEAVSRLVSETVARGEQVYVVYPLVEESERVDLRSAIESAERIARAFPDAPVDLVHGRLDATERRAAMQRFEDGETRILVSTTVIEVGVDVSRATLMVIEHAERFGLAQLHQLRGRVGRGELPGTCVMVSRARPRSEDRETGEADPERPVDRGEARLKAMMESTDGFEIANADLRIRGPGEFLGTRQSGHLPDLRVADLLRDARLLAVARAAAFATVRRDPRLSASPALRAAVARRWGERLALVGVA